MTCPDELEVFLFCEGEELPEEQSRRLAEHLATCERCKAAAAELGAIGAGLAPPEAWPAGVEDALVLGVHQRLARERASAAPEARRAARVVRAARASALGFGGALVVVLVLALTSRHEEGPGSAGPQDRLVKIHEGVVTRGCCTRDQVIDSWNYLDRHRNVVMTLTLTYGGHYECAVRGPDGAFVPVPASVCGVEHDEPSPIPADAPEEGGPPGAVEPVPELRAPRPAAIDPNGRFATRYRPRGDQLASCVSARPRSGLGDPSRPLPTLRGGGPSLAGPRPDESAIALDLRAEMARLPPDGGPVHLAITLRSTDREPAARPRIAVHLVVDVSGSMAGAPLAAARRAALALVDRLEPSDRFSLVAYEDEARVVLPEGPVGPRRAAIEESVRSLEPGNGTNLEAGLLLGYGQIGALRDVGDQVQLVVVLSDGMPNVGATGAEQLAEIAAEAFEAGVETTTIGVGAAYDPHAMSAVAEAGAGGYYSLPDPSAIEGVLRAELEQRTRPVARAVALRVRLGPGVELLEAYGSPRLDEAESARVRRAEIAIDRDEARRDGIERDRHDDRAGGMRFFIPGFSRDDEHTILLRLRAPPGGAGTELALATVELAYKDRVEMRNGRDEQTIRVERGTSTEEARASVDLRVRRAVLEMRTGLALVEASRTWGFFDREGAGRVLWERARLLDEVADRLADQGLREEADQLEAMREAVARGTDEDDLALAAMVRCAGEALLRRSPR